MGVQRTETCREIVAGSCGETYESLFIAPSATGQAGQAGRAEIDVAKDAGGAAKLIQAGGKVALGAVLLSEEGGETGEHCSGRRTAARAVQRAAS